jgi:hypothetical protein
VDAETIQSEAEAIATYFTDDAGSTGTAPGGSTGSSSGGSRREDTEDTATAEASADA